MIYTIKKKKEEKHHGEVCEMHRFVFKRFLVFVRCWITIFAAPKVILNGFVIFEISDNLRELDQENMQNRTEFRNQILLHLWPVVLCVKMNIILMEDFSFSVDYR